MTVEALRARALSAGEIVRRVGARLLCAEARLRQWDWLTQVVDRRLEQIERDLEDGKQVKFPVRVSDTYKVIRPDGSIAPGLRLTVRLEIFPEDMLWLETAHASNWDAAVEAYLSADARLSSPARLARANSGRRQYNKPADGMSYRPGGDRRFLVCYAGRSGCRS